MRFALRLGEAAVGSAIVVGLVALSGSADIGRAIIGAGWGVLLLIAFHLTQLAFSEIAWRAVLPHRFAPRCAIFMGLGSIRESIVSPLPVARIGGEIVGIAYGASGLIAWYAVERRRFANRLELASSIEHRTESVP